MEKIFVDLLAELNEKFFSGKLGKIRIDWSEGKWPRLLGQYQLGKIVISQSLKVDERKVRFVLFHLLIHHWQFSTGRKVGHTTDFYQLEWGYDDFGIQEVMREEGLLAGLDRDYDSAARAAKKR